MNRVLVQGSAFYQICLRRFSTSECKNIKVDLSRIKKKQAQFQVDDGVPVYIKGGPTDKILYYTTLVLMVAGLGLSCNAAYKMHNKK